MLIYIVMLNWHLLLALLIILLSILLVKTLCIEKFTNNDLVLLNNRTKCEECCNQLQQKDSCKKKCIFEGAVCRCCDIIPHG